MNITGDRRGARSSWKRFFHSLGARLGLFLFLAMVSILTVLGYFNIKHHRTHLEQATLLEAERVSDLIERSANYSMLRNDREGLIHILDTIAGQQGVVGIRIADHTGRIALSTDRGEEGMVRDSDPAGSDRYRRVGAPLDANETARIHTTPDGLRIMEIVNPIENQPGCWNAACHAHPRSQQVLGVMETRLSLARADEALAEGNRALLIATLAALAFATTLTGFFVWRMVHRPIKALHAGTSRLAAGELGYQISLRESSELGELARSFNSMSRELEEAREEITAWTRTLEKRVEEKSREVKRAHESLLHVEKMASIGKLAATVAHEINNPLSGIFTYAKILRRHARKEFPEGARLEAFDEPLQVIELESRRCGDIVKNLLRFSRTTPMVLSWESINSVLSRVMRLVSHQIKLSGIQLHTDLCQDLPLIRCDAGQLEQALLALVMNAIEALSGGGNLWLSSRAVPESGEVAVIVRDDGAGIPREIQESVFEPFFTTKETGTGIGLGLAVCKGIVERHGGAITLESTPGRFTSFTLRFPADIPAGTGAPAPRRLERQGEPS